MPSPPLNGTLIRRSPGLDNGAGLNQAREWWYDPEPTVRAVALYLIEDSADFSSFGLDPAVIIDRWCLAPGVAPYTEIQVHHSNATSSSVVFLPVDGATACQYTCTLGLTLTASPVSDGRVTLTATASGAQGSVLFSLDAFDTPGLAPNGAAGTTLRTWERQRTGTYTVTAQETRIGGCSASATLTVQASYAPRYEHAFKDADNAECLLRIFQREYSGAVEVLDVAQRNAVTLDYPGGATDHVYTTLRKGSECQLALYITEPDQFRPLFSGDERLHRVDYLRSSALVWRGYLLPEQYDTLFLAPPTTFNLSAADGLGTLSTLPFQGPAGQRLKGDWTLLQAVLYCLGKLELDLPLHVLFNLFPASGTVGSPAVVQIKLDVAQCCDDKNKPWDCGKLLLSLLTTYGCRLYQEAGAWRLERLIELTAEPMAYQVFAPDGTRAADVTHSLLRTVNTPNEELPQWRGATQRQGLRGAVSTITATSEPGEMANLLRFVLPKPTDLPGEVPSGWLATTSIPGVPFSQLLYAGKDKTPLLRLIGTAAPGGFYASPAARQAAALAGPFVQTPVLPAIPLPFGKGGTRNADGLVLRLTLKPYGVTPAPTGNARSAFYMALHYGENWVNGNVGAATESPTTVILQGAELSDDGVVKEIDFVINGFASAQVGPQPIYLRFYAPVGGATAPTVDITDWSLVYDDSREEEADFVTTTTTDTGNLVSRVDGDTTLFHVDTPHSRYGGTLLDANGLPTLGWFEADAPGQVRDVADYLVRDRALWQRSPAQVLLGTLRGNAISAGCLLTDPQESHPGVYLLTSATHDATEATWQVTAVQLLPIPAPPVTLPPFAIYYEDDRAWLGEDGRVLTYEHA